MRAVVWRGKHDVRIADVPDPSLVNPHDAIVRVTLTALGASDLELYNGAVPGMERGHILGRELMGTIVEVGPACERANVGQRVVVMSAIACGRCWFCRHQQPAGCDNTNPSPSGLPAMFGSSHLHGGYAGGQAEYVRVPFADIACLVLPPEVADEQALFLGDILPTGYQAALACDIQPGDTVAVFGADAVSQMAIRCALLLGADRVIAIDSIPARLRMAADAGALIIDESHGALMQRLDDLTGGRGPDACIDAIGMHPAALRTAILACRKFGTIAIAGSYSGLVDKFPLGAAYDKGLTFRMGHPHVHRYAGDLLRRVQLRHIDPSVVITHRMSLEELPRAYAMASARGDGYVKVIARP